MLAKLLVFMCGLSVCVCVDKDWSGELCDAYHCTDAGR